MASTQKILAEEKNKLMNTLLEGEQLELIKYIFKKEKEFTFPAKRNRETITTVNNSQRLNSCCVLEIVLNALMVVFNSYNPGSEILLAVILYFKIKEGPATCPKSHI